MDTTTLLLWLKHHSIVPIMAVFLLMVITTFWPGRKATLERNGRIPLQDDR